MADIWTDLLVCPSNVAKSWYWQIRRLCSDMKCMRQKTGVSGDHAHQLGAIDTILQQYADQYSIETNHNKLYVYKRGADSLSKQATLQKWLKLADELTRQLG
jgi:hypothetical protein